MNLVEKYNYPSLKRFNNSGKRLYNTPSGNLPSVTTILDRTKDKTFLVEWRKRVGEEEATRITKEASGLGTMFHKHLENYILISIKLATIHSPYNSSILSFTCPV